MQVDPAWRKTLLRKGQDISDLLAALLAGKDVDLGSLPLPGSGDDDKETRLRRFLEQIDRAVKCFGTGWYGRCQVCDIELQPAALSEQPWISRCQTHAAH
jgi:RNA polymerase-binding transcription factor DksA